MYSNVAVIGAGSWGTAMAGLLSSNAQVVLWARRPELASQIAASRRNPAYLPDLVLPGSVEATASMPEAVGQADVVVMAVPSHGFRSVLEGALPCMRDGVPVVGLAKGLESHSLKRMSEVVQDLDPTRPAGMLTGPNLAAEVAAGQPTAGVLAFSDPDLALRLQPLFATFRFRVYTNPDLIGCEIAGALKNVVAIASGMATGLGFGDNTRAALITRGLAELARLGVALGAAPVTFGGLAGMGDLVATCTSQKSRNRYVGEQLGRGRALAHIVAEMSMVAEGIKTCSAAVELAARKAVELPIAEQVVAVVRGERSPADALPALLERRSRPEIDWAWGQ